MGGFEDRMGGTSYTSPHLFFRERRAHRGLDGGGFHGHLHKPRLYFLSFSIKRGFQRRRRHRGFDWVRRVHKGLVLLLRLDSLWHELHGEHPISHSQEVNIKVPLQIRIIINIETSVKTGFITATRFRHSAQR
jgi:hypothetical protein